MKIALITLASIVGLALMMVCFVMSSKNAAISLEENVNAAKSGIDAQLTNRFNKLSELTECVEAYDAHEYKVLKEVIEARGKNMTSGEVKQTMLAIAAVAEQYPVLQSQKNYQQLMTEVALTENHLAQHKKAYNESVRGYRYHCRKFPSSLFLAIVGYEVQRYEMYVADEAVRDSKPMSLFK